MLFFAVYGDNRWSPVGGAGADTLDLRRSRSPLPESTLDSFSSASQWWARQDRSGDEYREDAAGRRTGLN